MVACAGMVAGDWQPLVKLRAHATRAKCAQVLFARV